MSQGWLRIPNVIDYILNNKRINLFQTSVSFLYILKFLCLPSSTRAFLMFSRGIERYIALKYIKQITI